MMLVGSILIGAIAGFALLNYVNGVEQDIQSEQARVEVWVVSQDIAAGTTAADVQNTSRLELRSVETQFRPANAVTDLSQIQGRVAVNNLAANQILVTGMFDDPEAIETTFSDLLENDQIAFTIEMPALRAVGGKVEPGDFVDIIVQSSFTAPAVDDTGGAFDVFDNSAQDSVYQTPARFLYRGVRIVGINDDFVGQAVPEEAVPGQAPAETGSLQLTFALPPDAAQKILSIPTGSLFLALLPDDFDPANPNNGAIRNEIPELIQSGEDLPGENPDQLTPYGPTGFVDVLADEAADGAEETADVVEDFVTDAVPDAEVEADAEADAEDSDEEN